MSDSIGVVLLVLGFFIFVIMAIGLLIAPPNKEMSQIQSSPLPPKADEDPGGIELLERLGQEGRIQAAEDEGNRRWLRPIGLVSRLLSYAILFVALFIFAPKDISNRPLATLTLSDIAGPVGFIGVGILLVRALFNPSDDDQIKDAWGWLGVVILGLAIIVALIVYTAR